MAKWMIIAVLVGLAAIIFIAYCVVTPKVSRLEQPRMPPAQAADGFSLS